MKFFPPWHTPESVAARLIAGLEDGSLTLDDPAAEESETGGAATPPTPTLPPARADESKAPQLDTSPVRG